MLSLKVFDRSRDEELLEAYRRATALILEALLHQGVAGDESELVSFRDSIGGVIERMSSAESKTPDIWLAAGTATTAIHEYNRHVVSAVRDRRLELEAVVGMLTKTMSEIGSGSGRSLSRLLEIESRLAKSQELYDLRELRQQMSQCLTGVREEAASRRKESDRLIADLKLALQECSLQRREAKPAERTRTGRGHDPIEETISQAAKDDPNLFVAILAIDHLRPVAASFGEPAAVKVAEYCAAQARKHLSDAHRVIVWKRNACVALMDGSAGAESVEWSVSHEAQHRRSMMLDVDGREVLLHVTYSKWLLLPVAGRTAADVVDSMNAFMAQVVGAPKVL